MTMKKNSYKSVKEQHRNQSPEWHKTSKQTQIHGGKGARRGRSLLPRRGRQATVPSRKRRERTKESLKEKRKSHGRERRGWGGGRGRKTRTGSKKREFTAIRNSGVTGCETKKRLRRLKGPMLGKARPRGRRRPRPEPDRRDVCSLSLTRMHTPSHSSILTRLGEAL